MDYNDIWGMCIITIIVLWVIGILTYMVVTI